MPLPELSTRCDPRKTFHDFLPRLLHFTAIYH